MGIFDAIGAPFGPNITGPISSAAQNAYQLAQQPLQQGINAINQLYPQAQQQISSFGTQAAAPYQYLTSQFQGPLSEYLSAIGGGGPNSAWNTFTRSPLFTSGLKMGTDAINAADAASGQLASGKQITDLSKFSTDYTSQLWGQFINALLPGVSGAQTAAGGLSGVYGNTGTNYAQSQMGQANALQSPYSSLAQLGWSAGLLPGLAGASQNIANANIGGNIATAALGLAPKLLALA